MAQRLRRRPPAPLASIQLLVLDIDGVMTDGRLYYGPDGELEKCFHVRDGHGLKAVMAAGIAVAVLSGRRSQAVQRRCQELGIAHVYQGLEDKGAQFAQLTASLGLYPQQCAYIGDDEPDLPMLKQVGLAVAVADAHPLALAEAHRRTKLAGGTGAVREVCDWLLAARVERPARGAGKRARPAARRVSNEAGPPRARAK